MMRVDREDWDCAKTRAIGWTLSMLATVEGEMETVDLFVDSKSQYYG